MVFLSFAFAYVISILIEMPMLGLTKAMFGKNEVKKLDKSPEYTDEIKLWWEIKE